MTTAKFTGQAYQLSSSRPLTAGSYVQVNGPWDTFGRVTSCAQKTDGTWLNQVRGVKAVQGEKPVYQF